MNDSLAVREIVTHTGGAKPFAAGRPLTLLLMPCGQSADARLVDNPPRAQLDFRVFITPVTSDRDTT